MYVVGETFVGWAEGSAGTSWLKFCGLWLGQLPSGLPIAAAAVRDRDVCAVARSGQALFADSW